MKSNLRKEIKQAYDTVHAPEEAVEKLKQELYLKDFQDFTESPEETVTEHTGLRRYAGFIAAAAVLGLVVGLSIQSISDCQNEEILQPAATVPVQVTVSESTEPTSETAPDA